MFSESDELVLSDPDEEHWQKKEARRLARDTAELNPVTLGGPLNPVM